MRKLFFIVLFAFLCFYSFAQSITRGPYLQKRTQTGIQVRFRTDVQASVSVKIGNAFGAYSQEFFGSGLNTDHLIEISGLQPYTKYFYAIFNGNQLLEGGPLNFFFHNTNFWK